MKTWFSHSFVYLANCAYCVPGIRCWSKNDQWDTACALSSAKPEVMEHFASDIIWLKMKWRRPWTDFSKQSKASERVFCYHHHIPLVILMSKEGNYADYWALQGARCLRLSPVLAEAIFEKRRKWSLSWTWNLEDNRSISFILLARRFSHWRICQLAFAAYPATQNLVA